MRILVYPHELILGGSQINAVDIGAHLHRRGHEVLVYGRPGPLCDRVRDLGLELVTAPPEDHRPSPTSVRALADLVRVRGIDVLHGYEWPPALEAVLAGRLSGRAVPVATVMSMQVASFLPRGLELVVGTEQIAARERERGRRRVTVIEPPVDLDHDVPPPSTELAGFRAAHGLAEGDVVVVCVTRLAHEMKLEGVLAAVRAVGDLAFAGHPVRLLVVGSGPAHAEVQAAADAVEARTGRRTVVLTGELADPRPAYAVADVALAMGSSALRALAHGAPLVVQGERGFWRLLDEASVDDFLWTGWYGYGDDAQAGPERLAAVLRPLLADPASRARLGAFGRDLVRGRFSLASAADRQLAVYERALDGHRGPGVVDLARSVAGFGTDLVRRRAARRLGRPGVAPRPVAQSGPARPERATAGA